LKNLVRGCFLLLMVLALHERIVWYRLGQASPPPLNSVAQKLDALGLQNSGPDRNGLIQSLAPGCAISFPVAMFALDGGEDARIAEFLPPDSVPVYVYLGRVSSTRPQLHPVTASLAASLAAMAGVRSALPPTKLVLAALPEKCQHLAALNWASVSQ
jgi:hypothetical protein